MLWHSRLSTTCTGGALSKKWMKDEKEEEAFVVVSNVIHFYYIYMA